MASKITDEQGNLTLTNTQVLNTVRKYAPNDYQHRVPVATQGNIQSVLQAVNRYQPNWDVFWNIFIGRIGRTTINERLNFKNPLAPFKQAALTYGMTMQEIQPNLIKARIYNNKGDNVFGRETREPDIHQAFHTQNRNNVYELNIPMEDVLRGAFIEGESISSFWNSLSAIPVASAQNDEYILMRDITATYDKLHGFYNLHVDDISEGSFEEQQHRGAILIQKMRATYNKLKFYNTKYSPEGRETGLLTKANNVIAIISADVESVLKTITTAYAFNQQNQDIIADQIIVVDELPIKGCQALLLDENWYQCADTLGPLQLQSPMNPQNMSYNTFLHIWQILSYSVFLPGIMFSTRPDTELGEIKSTVTGVTLQDEQGKPTGMIQPHESLQLIAKVEGTNMPNQAVRYEIKAFNGQGASMSLPAEVYMDSLGVFHSGNAQNIDRFIISATSLQDESFSADYIVDIGGMVYVENIACPDIVLENKGSFTAKADVKPDTASDKRYKIVVVDDQNIALTSAKKITDGSFTITDVAGVAGDYKIVLLAQSCDPHGAPVQKTVKVTVKPKPAK